MKSAEDLRSKLGGRMRESMGQYRPDAAQSIPAPSFQADDKYAGVTRTRDSMFVEIGRVIPDPDQPRRLFDEDKIAELAESLNAEGQMLPCEVRYDEPSKVWVIISGERRYRAAIKAGLPTLKVIEDKTPYDANRIFLRQLVENLQRADLKPSERARAYRKTMDQMGWDYRALSAALKISLSSISRSMAILDLPPDVQDGIDKGQISATAAAAVAKVPDEEARKELVARVVSGDITADEAAAEARAERSRSKKEQDRAGKAKAKGRGAKAKSLPTSRIVRNLPHGIRIEATARKGFDASMMLEALRASVLAIEAEVGEIAG